MFVPDIPGILDAMNSNGDVFEEKNFEALDLDGDDRLTVLDCPFDFGTPEAQLWWKKIMVPYTKGNITEQMREDYGSKVVGAYKGKPLIPGEAGKGQGDFSYMVDKLQVTQALEWYEAREVAAKAYVKNYVQVEKVLPG